MYLLFVSRVGFLTTLCRKSGFLNRKKGYNLMAGRNKLYNRTPSDVVAIVLTSQISVCITTGYSVEKYAVWLLASQSFFRMLWFLNICYGARNRPPGSPVLSCIQPGYSTTQRIFWFNFNILFLRALFSSLLYRSTILHYEIRTFYLR